MSTPVECRACQGKFLRKDGGKCDWCTAGLMDDKQFDKWMRSRSGPRPAATSASIEAEARKSTQRFVNHRAIILERVERSWSKADGMRLGMLIIEALSLQHMTPEILATLDDKRLAEILEYYVLMSAR